MMRINVLQYACRAVSIFCVLWFSAQAVHAVERESAETEFNRALTLLLKGQVPAAGDVLDAVIAQHPQFRLAQIVRADIFAMQTGQPALLSLQDAQNKVRIADLIAEAKSRYGYRADYANKMPDVIMRLSSIHRYALLFDAEQSRLYVLENAEKGPQLIKDYYASHGRKGMYKTQEGDSRTPTGVYKITQFYPDDELPELYGKGAYTLDYPNRWDRTQGHSGGGIWLHGVPRFTHSRPPLASRGCVVLSNLLFSELGQDTPLQSAPVVLSEEVRWIDRKAWLAKRRALIAALTDWKKDWQSLDVEKYLAHYSSEYRDETADYATMVATTKRNAHKKSFIQIGVKNIDVILYSRKPTTIFATYFDQDYHSNNYSVAYRKQQLWRLEGGGWKIIYEGRA